MLALITLLALLTLGKWRLRQVTAKNPARGAFIRKLLSTPQDLLATITLGNTLAHAAIIASVLVISFKFDQKDFLLVALTLVVGLLLFCEVIPKTLAMRHPEAWGASRGIFDVVDGTSHSTGTNHRAGD